MEQLERDRQATGNLSSQQKLLEEAKQEIEKLKIENKNIEQKADETDQVLSKIAQRGDSQLKPSDLTIQATEIESYRQQVRP